MTKILCLMIGGVAGTLTRYFLSNVAAQTLGTSFPYGTLSVNLLGCLILGFVAAWPNPSFDLNLKFLLAVGFCGAFTTFSTFILETDSLLKGGIFPALLNVMISVIFGFLAFRLGAWAARAF